MRLKSHLSSDFKFFSVKIEMTSCRPCSFDKLFIYVHICLDIIIICTNSLKYLNLYFDAERKGGFSSSVQARFAKRPFYRFSSRHVSSWIIFHLTKDRKCSCLLSLWIYMI